MEKKIIFITIFFLILLNSIYTKPSLSQQSLRIGTIIPFTGRWGDYGKECARGILDGAKWLNQKEGILGRKIEIILIEDPLRPSELIAAFRKLNESDRILLLYVYSIETAMDLVAHGHFHRLPMIMGTLPHPLSNPTKYPFIFSITPTPLDLSKIGMKFLSEKNGLKVRRPKLIFIGYPDFYGKHFLDEAKEFGKSLGIEIGPDFFVSDFSNQRLIPHILQPITHYNPDFIFSNLTSKENLILIQEANNINLKSKWLCNMRGFDENLLNFEGILGIQPISPFGEDIPGMAPIKEAHQKWHPYDSHSISYVEGWATIQVIAEALKRALPEERLSRDSIKSSFESFRNFVVGGLVPPITISAQDHRPSLESRIFLIKDKKILRFTSFISLMQ
jgi:branched-chain amino acid transport system substrate-binding protein